MATDKERKENAIALLKAWLPRNKRVYFTKRHWTNTGTNYFDVYYVSTANGFEPMIMRITSYVALATGYAYDDRREAIRTKNDGVNIIHDLGSALYKDYQALAYGRL